MKIDLKNNEKVASINYKYGIEYYTITINKGFFDFEDFKNDIIVWKNTRQIQCYKKGFKKIVKSLKDAGFVVYIRNKFKDDWQIYNKETCEQYETKEELYDILRYSGVPFDPNGEPIGVG